MVSCLLSVCPTPSCCPFRRPPSPCFPVYSTTLAYISNHLTCWKPIDNRHTVIDIARMACGRVYVTVRCPSDHLSVYMSVCLSYRPRCSNVGLVCCCGPGGRKISIDCCTVGAQQQLRRSSTLVSSICEQCRVYSRRTILRRSIWTCSKCAQFYLKTFSDSGLSESLRG